MNGTACSAACGWCGACSSDWEGPQTVTVTCVACGEPYAVDADERPPYRCEACCAQPVSTAQPRQGVA
jgi:hypothetical protein